MRATAGLGAVWQASTRLRLDPMPRYALLASASLLAALAPAAARAADTALLEKAEPEIVLEVAKGFGSATMDKDNAGDPMIAGRLQGLKYVIYFYGCTGGRNCRSIQLATGYTDKLSAERADAWNGKFRWIRSYEGDGSNFRMDVDFAGGVTRAHPEEQLATWDSLVGEIKSAATTE